MLIPETPRWLASHDRPDDCLRVLARMKSSSINDPEVQRQHHNILQVVAFEASIGTGSWKDLLSNDRVKSQTRLLIACSIQAFQQLGGINAVICKSSASPSRMVLSGFLICSSRLYKHAVFQEHRF